ncbi:MAG: ParB/RepB/Spo0J family partition protein [Candidatus Porifericomitaceae bacterium WSBS_2022_MAG_OTU9]
MPTDAPATSSGSTPSIPIAKIRASRFQPRRNFDQETLAELAASIKRHGVLQPVLVRPAAAGHYELLAGERRWRASQLAGLDSIPAQIKEYSDNDAACIALVENLQRDDLNPIETARGMARLYSEFKLTHENIATSMGCSRSAVTNMLRLLELATDVRELTEQGKLDMGHARALLTLHKNQQRRVADIVIRDGLTVRATEELVRRLTTAKTIKKEKKVKQPTDPDILSLQKSLATILAANVSIKHQDSGKGQVVIDYGTLDELDGILERIGHG